MFVCLWQCYHAITFCQATRLHCTFCQATRLHCTNPWHIPTSRHHRQRIMLKPIKLYSRETQLLRQRCTFKVLINRRSATASRPQLERIMQNGHNVAAFEISAHRLSGLVQNIAASKAIAECGRLYSSSG